MITRHGSFTIIRCACIFLSSVRIFYFSCLELLPAKIVHKHLLSFSCKIRWLPDFGFGVACLWNLDDIHIWRIMREVKWRFLTFDERTNALHSFSFSVYFCFGISFFCNRLHIGLLFRIMWPVCTSHRCRYSWRTINWT